MIKRRTKIHFLVVFSFAIISLSKLTAHSLSSSQSPSHLPNGKYALGLPLFPLYTNGAEGLLVGLLLGLFEGLEVGESVGFDDGESEGAWTVDGRRDTDGFSDGFAEGFWDGAFEVVG